MRKGFHALVGAILIGGLALLGGNQATAAAEAYREALANCDAAGVVKEAQDLLESLARLDETGVLAGVTATLNGN